MFKVYVLVCPKPVFIIIVQQNEAEIPSRA